MKTFFPLIGLFRLLAERQLAFEEVFTNVSLKINSMKIHASFVTGVVNQTIFICR
jgi:hypothetical protein